ncbi:MAG: glycoside hydrolase family 16 protein [Oscillospiraceae bacterium]|nr:glycoside hydrolase family 16 protein [Oscillospiraceae bacterium]
MKKLFVILVAFCMTLSVTGCGADKKDEKDTTTKTTTTTATTTAETEKPEEELFFETLFKKGPSPDWHMAAGWSNGEPFDCIWSENCVKFEDGVLKLKIDKIVEGQYRGGEYRTNDMYGYGLYEVEMKAIKNVGVVSSFFTYTGPSDNNPWDEIDIEFLGKDTTKVQFNYYTDGVGGHEYMHDLGFDASEDFHKYAFKWEKDKITWYVDGQEVYSATENLPSTPGKIMMNAWNGVGVDGWLGRFDGTTPLTAEYKSVKFTPIENL